MYIFLAYKTPNVKFTFTLPPPFHIVAMTRQSTRVRRRIALAEERFQDAVEAHEEGVSVRMAARIARLPRSTFHRKLKEIGKPRIHHRCALTKDEEQTIVDTIQVYWVSGHPLTHKDIMDAVELLVKNMPFSRRLTLPFRDGRPGRRFVKNFLARHKEVLAYREPLRQEAARFRAVNAETLTTHFAALQKVIQDNNMQITAAYPTLAVSEELP